MRMYLLLALLLVSLIFTVQNFAVMEISVFFWTVTASRALVLFLTLLAGVLIGWLVAQLTRKRAVKAPKAQAQD